MYFITGNEDKFAEVRGVLPFVERLDMDLPEVQELDARVIVEAKLKEACKHHSGRFIVEDVSLSIEGLKGLPGPLVKWFLQTLGPEGIAEMAEKSGNTKAVASIIYGYAKSAEEIYYFENSVNGTIVKPRGKRGFGWDPIFLPEGSDKTFAEMKEQIPGPNAMRQGVLDKLKKFLEEHN